MDSLWHDFGYLHSTSAELLRRLGRTDEARDTYRRARELTDDGAERRFLERRLTELAATTRPSLTGQRTRIHRGKVGWSVGAHKSQRLAV